MTGDIMTDDQYRRMVDVLIEVQFERHRQHFKWGEQDHPDGTGSPSQGLEALRAQRACDAAFRIGIGTYRHILEEEVREAFAESDQLKLRTELVQVGAVAAAWVEAMTGELAGLQVATT